MGGAFRPRRFLTFLTASIVSTRRALEPPAELGLAFPSSNQFVLPMAPRFAFPARKGEAVVFEWNSPRLLLRKAAGTPLSFARCHFESYFFPWGSLGLGK